MAGPSLSHILDPPRPATGRDIYSTPPPYAHRDSLQSSHRHQQPQAVPGGVPAPPGAVSPNTRNLSTPPVSLPPPTPASSTLQVRPAPAPAPPPPSSVPMSIGPGATGSPAPALGATSAPATSTPAHSHSRSPSQSQSHSQSLQGHGQGQGQLEPGAASAASPSSPGLASTTNTPASQSNHRGNNLYACRDCGRSYSRPEHLVRHVQTHTLGRRFVCEICQKSFARKDLLRRHVANHDNDSPKKRRRTTTSPGAGRVSHACRSCAIARVKCDDTKPCKRCVTRKLTCVSAEAPSTAAMHLMHFSANAHSSAGNANSNSVSDSENKPVTAHSSVTSRDSHSPGSFGHQQPRSLPAPHSAHEPAPQHHRQHRNHYHQHARASSAAAFPSSQAKLPSNEPSQLPTPETFVEQGRFRANSNLRACGIGRSSDRGRDNIS